MKQAFLKREKLQEPGINESQDKGREHLELLRSSRHFKHVIKKEKFFNGAKLDMLLTKLYMSL